MLNKKIMTEQENKLPNGELSPELSDLLRDESKEAEIKAAIDAAAEEGIFVTRDEVARMLLEKNQIKPTKNIKPL
ncbi:hypothetical protein A3F00_04515 [Candidatus Daviesbacteria bacterium RIFCSPHIGHO2_12_FULL_37_11]|uniref:Uncharacterized protein n=1 Tax=Candidatus Daviesbacteria bacterium RIFCSPHIGHO2_12_FULL_37_11 TaxID=1797777 RepID=A0A1F5K9T5_9BACT|nr:MAG: hypothetical protein A2769_03685 [Candidatus Daviesbacteria bacterium RIFCSPHIGHO2_01_FULL_37_27]OGE37687.1 MAG: hypothetical protein A3F00_04515 [Candidatus Daviesbacteria bacterium RIFCSPHIGHO2_12_FULL_37_11]OGE45442.1 MAG: hypothetical protein A3B39_04915 [Candidatus Daviesbacteria bacterium RIFCSPLOWO2_01_FULL_37_10]